MFHKHGIEFGGYRGACWISRTRVELYDEDSLSTDENAKFTFHLTSLIKNNTDELNNQMYTLMNQIQKRCNTNFMDTGV